MPLSSITASLSPQEHFEQFVLDRVFGEACVLKQNHQRCELLRVLSGTLTTLFLVRNIRYVHLFLWPTITLVNASFLDPHHFWAHNTFVVNVFYMEMNNCGFKILKLV